MITAQIQTLRGTAAAVLYELGTLLRQVDDEDLRQAGGYTSFTDYLERGVDVSETTARRVGLARLSRGLRYMAYGAARINHLPAAHGPSPSTG